MSSEENSGDQPQRNICVLNNEPRDYGSAKAYNEEVLKWYQHTRLLNQQLYLQGLFTSVWQYQPQYLPAAFNPIQMQQPQRNNNSALLRMRIANLPNHVSNVLLRMFAPGNPRTIIIQQYEIPSFLRRVAAEAIDCLIMFMLKLIVVYFMVELELIDLDQFDRILSNSADLKTLIVVTQGLFNIELAFKIFAAILEAYCITYGFLSYPSGCTPGKYFMRIRVISCIDINSVPGNNDRVSITRFENISFKSSIIRSLLKNLMTVFLFPLSTAFYIFSFNRAIYDLAAKTVVVNAW